MNYTKILKKYKHVVIASTRKLSLGYVNDNFNDNFFHVNFYEWDSEHPTKICDLLWDHIKYNRHGPTIHVSNKEVYVNFLGHIKERFPYDLGDFLVVLVDGENISLHDYDENGFLLNWKHGFYLPSYPFKND